MVSSADKDESADDPAGDRTAPAQRERMAQLLHRILTKAQLSAFEVELLHGITAPQAGCLQAIVLQGPLNHVELGRIVQLSTSTLTSILNRLEAKGLVTRIRSKHNGRRILVAATTLGMSWDRPRHHSDQDEQERAFAELGPPERHGIISALERLAAIFKA